MFEVLGSIILLPFAMAAGCFSIAMVVGLFKGLFGKKHKE